MIYHLKDGVVLFDTFDDFLEVYRGIFGPLVSNHRKDEPMAGEVNKQFTIQQRAKQSLLSLIRSPFYNIVIHTLISLAISTVHNPVSRDVLKQELRPLREALDELYIDDPSITQ